MVGLENVRSLGDGSRISNQELTSGEHRLQVRPYVQLGRIPAGAGRDHGCQGAVEVHLLRLQSAQNEPNNTWSCSLRLQLQRVYAEKRKGPKPSALWLTSAGRPRKITPLYMSMSASMRCILFKGVQANLCSLDFALSLDGAAERTTTTIVQDQQHGRAILTATAACSWASSRNLAAF